MSYFYGALIAAVSLLAMYVIFRVTTGVRTYAKLRGKRLVTCPADKSPAAVQVNAAKAALESGGEKQHIALNQCSHWPERGNCGQDCLTQIENDPEGCLVWNQVQQWYRGRSCAYCQQPIDKINWHDHRPAVMSPDRKTKQWSEIPPEQLPEVFKTYLPVCWSCHMAETFRREHPERVVDREPDSLRMSLYH